jgi:hypothetical protein
MTSYYDDNSTVIGESSGKAAAAPPDLKKVIPRETRLTGKKAEDSDFITPLHVPETDRPFFVRIERGGVIVALEELDRQLTAVSVLRYSHFRPD